MQYHTHDIQIYYEDTDLSGLVYHANYLKFFERAREHLLGAGELVRLYHDIGVGFVVYKAELTFREGARLGNLLEVRTRVVVDGRYRAIFHQSLWRPGRETPMVDSAIQLVCVDQTQNLVPIPEHLISRLAEFAPPPPPSAT